MPTANTPGARAELGLTDWFPPGQYERVETVLAEHRHLGVHHLRTVISWADYLDHALQPWFAWLIPTLTSQVELVPCFTATPDALGLRQARTSPLRDVDDFARFLGDILERYGDRLSWIELWNDPNHLQGWDQRLDPGWVTFADMVTNAARVCHQAEKKVILGGMCPADELWLRQMGRLGVLNTVDAVGVQGFPNTWEDSGDDWKEVLSNVQRVLTNNGSSAEIWITAAGYSTWQHNEFQQLLEFVRVLDLPVRRMHWYSVRDLFPEVDFEINLRGTLNLLEVIREQDTPPPLLFTSTNKVYGSLEDIVLTETPLRYIPSDELLSHGVNEARPLSFHSPYGCSKGGSDQYVLDYARIWGLRAVVLRMSCIHGPHQFGNEDQGWVAHFLLRAIAGSPITIFGNGKQVRDILYVHDLVEAMRLAVERIDTLSGQAFNLGGGARSSVSLLELIQLIGLLRGASPTTHFSGWRPGDQRYYVSDIRAFAMATGWQPDTSVQKGVEQLYDWALHNRSIRETKLSA